MIEGQGIFTLEDQEIVLEAGVFIVMPANTRHAVKAVTNLSFLLTLSEVGIIHELSLHELGYKAIAQ